jgi:hypothetical protein
MTPVALPKEIYQDAVDMGVEKIILQFQGGSDEGYMYVELVTPENPSVLPPGLANLQTRIEKWAWYPGEAYHYNGAGEGKDYGDDITYDLVNNTVKCEYWQDEPQYQEPDEYKMEVEGGIPA